MNLIAGLHTMGISLVILSSLALCCIVPLAAEQVLTRRGVYLYAGGVTASALIGAFLIGAAS